MTDTSKGRVYPGGPGWVKGADGRWRNPNPGQRTWWFWTVLVVVVLFAAFIVLALVA